MNFDFDNKNDWKKLFNPKASNAASLVMGPCVNDTPLNYARAMGDEKLATLGMKIRNYLIAQFQDERIASVKKITRWRMME